MLLNQEWTYHFESIGVTYSPWRLFFVIISLPTLLCGIGMLLFVPESPKFTFLRGNEEETVKILQYAYEKNYGTRNSFKFELPEARRSLPISVMGIDYDKVSPGMFESMWQQTVPLFKNSPMKILRSSYLEFAISFASNGFYAFFPEIMQKIGMWQHYSKYGNAPATVCEIVNRIEGEAHTDCNIDYETSALVSVYIMNAIVSIGWLILAFVIDMCDRRFTLNIMLIISAACSILLIFVRDSMLANIFYMGVVFIGVAGSVVNAYTAEIFTTQYRVMALTVSLIFGRLGGVAGAVTIGYLLETHCDVMLTIPAVLMGIGIVLVLTLPRPGSSN